MFRANWWNAHDQSNQFSIDELMPLLAQHERSLRNYLSDAYKTEWPEVRIEVDIVFHANWAVA